MGPKPTRQSKMGQKCIDQGMYPETSYYLVVGDEREAASQG